MNDSPADTDTSVLDARSAAEPVVLPIVLFVCVHNAGRVRLDATGPGSGARFERTAAVGC